MKKLRKPKTAKQIAAATKTILSYEWKDDSKNMMTGFVIGFSLCLVACFVGFGIALSV